MRLSEFLTEAPPVPAQPVAAPAIPTATQQARLKDMEAGQAKGKTAIDKFNQGDNVGGVMTAASGINDLANAAGMSFLDKLETGWIAIKAGARAAWAGRKGNADAAIVAAVGSLGGEVSELFDDIVNEPDFAQKFQQGMLAMKDSTEPDQQEMYKKYMSRQLTAESFKAYINRFNTAIQNMKKNPETAKLPTDDTPYVTPEELPTGPNANPMSRDPSQRATTTETSELNRILQLSGMEFIAENSSKSVTVQRGDTLGRIARDNATTVTAIVKLNNIDNPDRIYPGDVIRIPSDATGDTTPVVKKKSDSAKGTTTGNAKTAMDFFIEKGWSPEQAAGIVANLQAESYDRIDPAATGDKGRAYGIAQWRGPRQTQFEKILGKPLKGSSLEDQLSFVNWELHNTESSAGDRLRQVKTAADAAAVIDQFYERSSGAARQQRIASAKSLLTSMA